MKIIVAGGRGFCGQQMMSDILNAAIPRAFPSAVPVLVSGGASGADVTAEEIFKASGFEIDRYPAKWNDLTAAPCKIGTNRYGEKYNMLAGFNRNSEMQAQAEALIAVWNGKSTGTKDMIDKMVGAAKPVIVYDYFGKCTAVYNLDMETTYLSVN